MNKTLFLVATLAAAFAYAYQGGRTIASRYAADDFGKTSQYKLEINARVNPSD